ncbi:hypothetical protein GQ53DRAFT_888060 [Thozetella sp. PMI_491]|nr:hypothetical protein GQ53DRAFT_888060 [Thozetella sp. PMI_491]
MRFHVALAAAISDMAVAHPISNISPDSMRILPLNWGFSIVQLEGPGCPNYGNSPQAYVPRPTYGSNTVDGSEIYYWHFVYPQMRASVTPEEPVVSVWCETTVRYSEFNDKAAKEKPTADFRLKLHKNGTEILATYDLEDGVEAEWQFTYDAGSPDKIVDTIRVSGPRSNLPYAATDNSPVVETSKQWALPECGVGTIKYRTELTVTAKKPGAKGTVASEQRTVNGQAEFYGTQQGVSYDFEKCTTN